MVDAIDAWVDVIFFAVATQPLRRRPLRSLNFVAAAQGSALKTKPMQFYRRCRSQGAFPKSENPEEYVGTKRTRNAASMHPLFFKLQFYHFYQGSDLFERSR